MQIDTISKENYTRANMASITNSDIPSYLETPPISQVKPPINTRPQELPIEELSWQDFERLCLRLVRIEASVEHCQLYGVPGQKQKGIDIFARYKLADKYYVYQCKQVKNFGPAKIKKAVSEFLSGTWAEKTSTFVLCTRESFIETGKADEFERQAEILCERKIRLLSWDKDNLSMKLKAHPELVDDFFGRDWVRIFCGKEAEKSLGRRLSKEQVIEFRSRFATFYRNVFNAHDPGLPTAISDGINSLSLENRFVVPEICDRPTLPIQSTQTANDPKSKADNYQQENGYEQIKHGSGDPSLGYQKLGISRNEYIKNDPVSFRKGQNVEKWLSVADRSIVLGGPGSGKSTLLRYIAIDLLQETPKLSLLSQKWGQYLPIWISFAYWTKLLSENSQISLQDLLHDWLKSWDEERLWELAQQALDDKRLLLLVDGLDESTNEGALRVGIDRLMVFINQRRVPAIVTSRPHGFERVGIHDTEWQVGELSDFSKSQQKELSNIWFSHRLQILNANSEIAQEEIIRRGETEADHFLSELQRSRDLQDLAKVPLLLCLLISLRMQKASLPQSRFKAYDQIIEYLVSVHPSKRKKAASLTISSDELSDEDIKLVLSVLAYRIQYNYGDGLIEQDEALQHIEEYLQDPQKPFGLSKQEARKQSRSILQIGQNAIGLLVRFSQAQVGFFHRALKEYLAAFYIASLAFDEKRLLVETNCANSQWREVILGLLHITKTQNEVEKLINIIWNKSKAVDLSEQMTIEYLLYETAFSDIRYSADLSREIANSAFKEVETGFWLPHRERTLDLILDGLRLTKQKELVQTKLQEWFPNRVGLGQNIFHEMAEWPKNKNVIESLWKGLYSEDAGFQRSAAQALADISNGDSEIHDRLISLANNVWDERIQAVAIEALVKGWPQDSKLVDIINAIRYSASPILRLMAIEGRVKFNLHNDEDWDELIKLGSRSAKLNSYWRDDVVLALISGWPHSQKTKSACLNSVLHERRKDEEFDQDIALSILLQDYPQDEEVVEYCISEIRNKDYPFLFAYLYGWSLLKDNFRDNTRLIEAIDEWLPKQKYHEPEMSFAALIGRTPIAKASLLSCVNDGSFPHWAVRALLDGWGMEDNEVATTLNDIAFGSNDKASRIAFLLPQIIPDKEICRKRLLTILKDPCCRRPDFVLDGFWLLDENKPKQDTEVVDAAIYLLDNLEKTNIYEVSDIHNRLILYYPLDNRVREIAALELKKREGCYSAITLAYKDDAGFRDEVMKIVCPLPSFLRMRIASRLENSSADDDFALSLLGLYDYDSNPVVKTQASISYHTLLKYSGKDVTSALNTLTKDIVCYGPDHEERRQAAICGLLTLGRLDLMMATKETIGASARTSISISDGLNQNIPLIVHLLNNWDYLKEIFKDDFWQVISRHGNDKNWLWKNLCLFADDYSSPRNEAIQFFEDSNIHFNDVKVLRFLGRALPKSKLLLDYCLSSLPLAGISYSLNQLEIALTSAELIAEHFGGDEAVLHTLATELDLHDDWVDEGALMALCLGWPNCDALEQVWKRVQGKKVRLLYPTFFHLISAKDTSSKLFNQLSDMLSGPTHITVWTAPGIAKPIIRRLRKDEQLYNLFLDRLDKKLSPNEKASLPRILCLARGASYQLRSWCQEEVENQIKTIHPCEIGFDLISSSFRPVAQSLMNVLWTE